MAEINKNKIEDTLKDSMTARVVKEIKDVDNNVTGVLVPILRDTVADYRKVVNKLLAVIFVLIFGLIILGIVGYFIISVQIEKYNEFLSQFDFETDTIYQETNDYSDINSGINVNNSTGE